MPDEILARDKKVWGEKKDRIGWLESCSQLVAMSRNGCSSNTSSIG